MKINKAAEPPGEARADWWIVQEIARCMGREKYFTFDGPRAIFDEMRVASRGGNADYYGITWEKIEQNRHGSCSLIQGQDYKNRVVGHFQR